MSEECSVLHDWFNSARRFHFPFEEEEIPLNGIYVLFERGELAHGADRIVRIGTHTGKNQLRSRLRQHFLNENKDRSIFRQNIGRVILKRENDSFLRFWDINLTTKKAREEHSHLIDFTKQREVEKKVSKCIQNNFSFAVFRVDEKEKRHDLELKMISTISLCDQCSPSGLWLGLHSPIEKIQKSGLWLVQGLHKKPLSNKDMVELENLLEDQNEVDLNETKKAFYYSLVEAANILRKYRSGEEITEEVAVLTKCVYTYLPHQEEISIRPYYDAIRNFQLAAFFKYLVEKKIARLEDEMIKTILLEAIKILLGAIITESIKNIIEQSMGKLLDADISKIEKDADNNAEFLVKILPIGLVEEIASVLEGAKRLSELCEEKKEQEKKLKLLAAKPVKIRYGSVSRKSKKPVKVRASCRAIAHRRLKPRRR